MRFIASSRSLLLAATAAALCLPSALAHITVEDNFLDEAAREDILAQLPGQTRFKHTLDVPGQLYQRLMSIINPSNTDLSHTETSVPAKGEGRFVPAHKDVFEDNALADGQVGLVYLEGDGRMLFQHEVTGEETVVDVQPGRLMSWDNSVYTHTLIPGDLPRRILGPMAFRDGEMQSIGDQAPRVVAQARTNSLTVRPGGIIRVGLSFVVLDVDGNAASASVKRAVRKLENKDLVIGCGLMDQNRRMLGGRNKTTNANDDITFVNSKLKPNFYKPKLTFNNTLDAVYWTLPSETTKILHPYKITWAFRVGKGVPSGTVVPIGVVIEDDNTPEFLVELRVLVK